VKRVLLINPITDVTFNEITRSYVRRLVDGQDLDVDVVNLGAGPAAVETYFDEGFAGPGIVDLIVKNQAAYNGMIVNCFADPGVEAARELVDLPVIGPAEASMLLASTLGHKFSVISTFKNSGPWVERQARALGIESRLASATGVDIHVLDLNVDPAATARAITAAARAAIERDGAEVIVLGCTGMAPLAEAIRRELGVPVVEPTAAALRMLQALLDLGLRHSKVGAYTCPVWR